MIDELGAASVPAGRGLRRVLPSLCRDAVGLGAVGSISYGAWLVTPAAGFIVGGSLVLAGVLLTARLPARAE